jgi:transcriptional regulator GlxA family with amidase domain
MDLSSSMVHAPAAASEHETLLGELMISVVERYSDWRNVGPARQGATGPMPADWRVRKAISIVRRNPAACDSVDRLAAAAGMSRANFFRMFQASTGVTPRVFINMLRLERAVQVAVDSDISFGHLSESLGFSNQAHFTRFFRDHAGVVPSHFRSISRLGDPAGLMRI